MLLEVVVTNLTEALAAQNGGASRVELVAEFGRGGLTPKLDHVAAICARTSIPVHVMLRPHDDGFVYDAKGRTAILDAAARMRDLGAAGVVFGALDERGHVDVSLLHSVLEAARLPLTFHRAFDLAASLSGAYAMLAGIAGVDRVLTSGGAPSAWEGRNQLRELAYGNTMPTVLAAGGINARNLVDLVRFARLREVHVGRGVRTDGNIDEAKVERVARLLTEGAAR